MRIVIDSYIPFVAEAIRHEWPDVEICPTQPDQIDSGSVRDADVLVVRTRTRVDEVLLAGSRVRLVCTATIGYDHIDTAWCEANRIQWMSCPGCNAQAVCDYIEAAIEETMDNGLITNTPTIGVVGVGHVGSLVAKMAERKGYRVLLNDPPKGIGVPLDEIARNSDIITFHVPLVKSRQQVAGNRPEFPTYHLCDAAFLSKCRPGALIINASRGGVVDEQALLRSGHPYVLDTWEKEPDIDPETVQHALLASMHIAGYSVQGKRNASQMCLDTIARTFGLPRINLSHYNMTSSCLDNIQKGDSSPGWLSRISQMLKARPTAFEELRKAYPLRGE